MPPKFSSSITGTQAQEFLSSKPERSIKGCKKIPGFHLIKLKQGGAWRYRYADDAGKRKVYTVGKFPAMDPETAAKKVLAFIVGDRDPQAEKRERRARARTAEELAQARRFETYLEGDYKSHQDRKKTGADTLALIRFNFSEWLDRDMASLSAHDVRKWQKRREGEGRAYTTLQRAYGAVKTMLNHAAKAHSNNDVPVLDENPLAKVTLDAPIDDDRHEKLAEARQSARRLLTDDEIQGLHQGLDLFAEELRRQRRNSRQHGRDYLPDLDKVEYPHWFIPFCLFALYTGMRPGDIYSLTWAEANVNFKRITKTPEKTRHHREPAKIVMDMTDPLHDVLKRWHRQQGKPQTGLVFASPVTGKRIDKKSHLKPWKRVKELGGLPRDLAFYALRHHFISTMVSLGEPLLNVAKLVGQKSTKMIEDHYGHLMPSSATSALNRFAQTVERKAVVHE